MVSASNRREPKSELDRVLEELVSRQAGIDKRVERLETLEFTHWGDGRGCLSFEDYDFVNAVAAARVDVDPTTAENGDYKATQAYLWWMGDHDGEVGAIVNLHMRINADANPRYAYAYKFTKGGALTQVGIEAQTSWIVGRLTDTISVGTIKVPFYPANWEYHSVLGDWTGYDTGGAAGTKQEQGEFGGYCTPGPLSINRFDFFPSAGNFANFRVMLYLWCPQLTPGFLPDD